MLEILVQVYELRDLSLVRTSCGGILCSSDSMAERCGFEPEIHHTLYETGWLEYERYGTLAESILYNSGAIWVQHPFVVTTAVNDLIFASEKESP